MRRNTLICSLGVLVITHLLCSAVSYGDSGTEKETLLETIQSLQTKVHALENNVDSLRRQLREESPARENVTDQMRDLEHAINTMRENRVSSSVPDVPAADAAIPAWLEGTRFGGSILVRWQSNFHNTANYASNNNNRNRFRMRVRYDIVKQLNDELLAGFRLATGTRDGNPRQDNNGFITNDGFLSGNRKRSNLTTGNADSGLSKFELWFDQAYLKYTPQWLDGLTIWAGKFQENWKHKGFLIYKHYVGFDGLGESFTFDVCDGLKADINLAQLIIAESTTTDGDAEMYVFDAGLSGEYNTDYSPITWGLRGTAYIFAGIKQGVPTAFTSQNSATMENPRTFVGTADLGFCVLDTMPVSLFGQVGINTNEHATDNQTEGIFDVRDQRHYWSCGIGINKLKEPGDWQFDYKFAYIERNVIPSGLAEDDIDVGNQAHWWILRYRWLASTDIDLTLIAPRRLDGDKETETLLGKLNVLTRF